MEQANRHRLGILMVAGSAVAYSTAGYFTRLIPLDVWTLLFWRGIFAGLFIAAILFWQNGRRSFIVLRGMGWPGLMIAALSTMGMMFFINALRLTTVADVALLFAAAPFVTALLAWLAIGERASRATLIASAIACLGIVIMVGNAASAANFYGSLLALGMVCAISAMMVAVRKFKQSDMVSVSCVSSFLTSLIIAPLATPMAASHIDLFHLALFGVTQLGLGLLLLTTGTQLISATESALISALDTPLAPIWVWLAFREVPTATTLLGGALVVLAVMGHILVEMRQRPAAA
ncbi:DMT family transporter [Dongia soli]|uniref:DMT family transporter n=1 Tax=Dongia soli TaxID=600628 RepID=A0ABU5E5D4_9PROT|nr:DMT family transporter [Dongia soli]MDY0881381.1 DMT family transporter [Dongia soli]